MSKPDCNAITSGGVPWLGGLAARDFHELDRLAVKLICLDSGFATPLRAMGHVIGERIAMENGEGPIDLDAALAALILACGLEGVIESRFLQRNAEGALLQITGCATDLGWQIPRVDRSVCGFEVGLFEGFLRGVTGDGAVRVEETACLGHGHGTCEFEIRRQQGPGEWEGAAHAEE